jgi:hypothetical protein
MAPALTAEKEPWVASTEALPMAMEPAEKSVSDPDFLTPIFQMAALRKNQYLTLCLRPRFLLL